VPVPGRRLIAVVSMRMAFRDRLLAILRAGRKRSALRDSDHQYCQMTYMNKTTKNKVVRIGQNKRCFCSVSLRQK